MSGHISVTVHRNGEQVVTIETNGLSGRGLSPADEAAIEWAASSAGESIGRPMTVETSREFGLASQCPITVFPTGTWCGVCGRHESEHLRSR